MTTEQADKDEVSSATTWAMLRASERACYEYPDDTELARAQRKAFCAGAGWTADVIERLRSVLKDIADGAWNIRHGSTNLSALEFARRALEEK